MQQYSDLVTHIQENGRQKGDRTGTGTRAVFGHMKRYRLLDGLPINGLKRTWWTGVKAELKLFMSGSTNNNVLKNLKTHIWDLWESPEGELGPVYSAMWRRWPVMGYDVEYVKIRTSEDTTELSNELYSLEDLNYMEDTHECEFMYSQDDRFKFSKQFLLWTYLIRCSTGHHKSSPLAQSLAGSKMCKAWHSFEQFRYDISTLGGYELWLEFPSKYILSCDYFGSSLLSRGTSLFTTRDYHMSITSEYGNVPAKVTNEGTNETYVLSTLTDFKEVTGMANGIILLGYASLTGDEGLKSITVNDTDAYFHECPEMGTWRVEQLDDLDNDVVVRRRLYIDQLADALETLKTNPTSRRTIVCGWNPELLPDTTKSFEDNANRGKQVLPPCHTIFQFNTFDATEEERIEWWVRENPQYLFEMTHQQRHEILADIKTPKIILDCFLYQRSCDIGLGEPFNVAFYSTLTELIAKEVGMICGDFVHASGDTHIYNNHMDDLVEVLERTSPELPQLKINDSFTSILEFGMDDVELIDYKPHDTIKLAPSA